jgi:hypothetical protein
VRIFTIFNFLLFAAVPCVSVQSQPARVISGKGVFFFGPSVAEADSIESNESEALSDFANYTSKVVPYLRARDIKCEYITARQIAVQYATVKQFVVSRDSVEFGTILTDGSKKPVLLKYVLTDSELLEKCKEYFDLK